MNKVPMTAIGYQKLQDELKKLINEDRPEIITAIAEARSHGDLSENAEYQYAKEQQSLIEGKILDLESSIETITNHKNYLGLICDLTDEEAIEKSIEEGTRYFGGIDMVILNAGIFPEGKRVSELSLNEWKNVFSVNLDANLNLLREIYPLLQVAPNNGRVVIIGSKNVAAPGPGAAAYSASKAALNQLMRVLSMEWGKDGIRLNTIHPNAVFDTGIWTEEVLKSRAEQYGLSVEEYKTNNLLGVEINSLDVSELAAEMCGSIFSKTTAAQIPIDGGNERVI